VPFFDGQEMYHFERSSSHEPPPRLHMKAYGRSANPPVPPAFAP
jgi:hypothetical protein